ncbi:hypothetical protein BBOV_III004810 [Babesia bovis T2Bo]|uniref:RAP domain-containing protein n=1 Tax=Babesia bovis TaxID=5865 RepID=A7ANB0_BABBO|nr:hypothetical protein BBOV_III004810 [Babesia bovis T2Bo]EDO08044.1 hypothetical protein BBOV_III004810 [Babesia bovis T2Bo]|eukprot:XP_001611612.1 hypothetical protein [Babesia bovis T2Bo]
MKAGRRAINSSRGRVFQAPIAKRIAGLSCLDLRKDIVESSRKHIRMRSVWHQYVQEVCKRMNNVESDNEASEQDKFTPTDISLILSAFASARKHDTRLFNILLEAVDSSIDGYYLRDFAVLYNALAKVGVRADEMINSFSVSIENKLTAKSSEKDLALLLNALLELNVRDIHGIFVKTSLIISSRIKYIANCHTLTLLLYSYSRYKGFVPRISLGPETSNSGLGDGNVDSSNLSGTHQEAVDHRDTSSPEETLITETTLSLLGRCADLMLSMQATDILYYYKSALNLIYKHDTGIKQHLYASIANIHKAHIRISERLLEFETRELVTLLQRLQQSLSMLEDTDPDSPLWPVNNEIQTRVPQLEECVRNELAYRTSTMSFTEALGYLKCLPDDDHRSALVYRRLCYKLNKIVDMTSWDSCNKTDLWELATCLYRRSVLYSSTELQQLVVALNRSITGTLKLKEVDLLCKLSAKVGAKSTPLQKKVMSVLCRADCLQPTQAASMVFNLVALGYIQGLEQILAACANINSPEEALMVLSAAAILKVNGLINVDSSLLESMIHIVNGTELSNDRSKNLVALLRVTGIANIHWYQGPYRMYPRMVAPDKHVVTRSVDLKRGNVIVNADVISVECCTMEIQEALQEFVKKFDTGTRVLRDYNADGIIVPIVVRLPTKDKVAIFLMVNDCYSGARQMLRLDAYTQLRLLRQRGIQAVCCRAEEWLTSDRTQYIARLVERCHHVAKEESHTDRDLSIEKDTRAVIPNTTSAIDSFSRLRMLVENNVTSIHK